MGEVSCFGLNKDAKGNAVSVCRERKRLLKLAVKRREAFAAAQCKYNNAQMRVAKSIGLFVAGRFSRSLPSSPTPVIDLSTSNTDGKHQAFSKQKPATSSLVSFQPTIVKQKAEPNSTREEKDRKQKGVVVEEWGEEETPRVVEQGESSSRSSWNNNNCFHLYNGMEGMYRSCADEIPEFEEVEEIMVNVTNSESVYKSVLLPNFQATGVSCRTTSHLGESNSGSRNGSQASEKKKSAKNNIANGIGAGGVKAQENSKGSKGKETAKEISQHHHHHHQQEVKSDDDVANEAQVKTVTNNNSELMKALEDIDGLFINAYEAGLDVSNMLDATRVQLRAGLIENSNSIVWSTLRNRSSSLPNSTSRKNALSFISHTHSPPTIPPGTGTGTVAEPKYDNISECGEVFSGTSHSLSLTMGKLYEWEKKLYQDVKMGETSRKLFEKECAKLRKEGKGDVGEMFGLPVETRLKVKSLDAKTLVSLEFCASISSSIIKVRDEELEPQLFQLLQGLMNMWKAISKSHEIQSRVMFEAATFNTQDGKCCSHFHGRATLALEAEIRKWCTSFSEYVTAQKAYIKALDAWFSTCNIGPGPQPDDEADESAGKGGSSSSVPQCDEPPLIAVCHEWLAAMDKLPTKPVVTSMKSFCEEIKSLSVQHGKERKQRKKVARLLRRFDRKMSALQKAENKILKLKESKREIDEDFQYKMALLDEKKISVEEFKHKVELEKAKHISGMEEMQRASLSGFQTGFSQVFESLVGFSKGTVKMYEDLVTCIDNVDAIGENTASSSS